MLKLFPNISITLEQIYIFKVSFMAEQMVQFCYLVAEAWGQWIILESYQVFVMANQCFSYK